LIGGLGLARGYLGREELTAERFVELEIGGAKARYYRTGDLVRRRRDRRLEYIARMDNQIKLRGFRIELGEIEAVLERHPLVRESAVVVRESGAGDPQLVAYLTWTQEEATAAEVRQYAGDYLPSYMVPAVVVSLEAFPRTPNGKLDRKALPAPASWAIESVRAYVAPRTPVEEELAEIWGELLGMDRVGVDDSFFDLGGHSLLVVQLASRLRDRMGVEIGLRDIYDASSLGALGDIVSAHLVADMALDLDSMEALLAEVEESAE
ncbi:MAG: phosphopantetheine-binding protein, partial [Actinomycetota bacterium]